MKICPDPVHDLLTMAEHGEHRQYRRHEYALLPLSPPTQFEVGGIALRRMEGHITQNNHALFALPNQLLKGVIRDIGGRTLPRYHQSPLVQHETQLAPDHPAVLRQSLATALVGTPALADGVDQRHAIRVDDTEPQSEQPGRPVSSPDAC